MTTPTDDGGPAEEVDYEGIPDTVSRMWLRLAEQMSNAIPDEFIGKSPEDAIHLALCAEACYWQTRGESKSANAHDVVAAMLAARKVKP